MLRAGIIGCGQIAGGYNPVCEEGRSLTHACSYQLLDGIELVAVSDPDAAVRKAFAQKWSVKSAYATHQEMLQNEKLDIVSICSPTEYHLDAFKAIADTVSVKGIFCEKPLSYDLAEAEEILALSKDKIVSLNYFRRWNPTLQRLRSDLNENKYGKIQYISLRYTKGLLTNGSHFVDLLYWMFGEPVASKTLYKHDDNSKDPGVDFKLDFEQGFSAFFNHIPNVPYVYIEIDILTERGKLSITQRGQQVTWYQKNIEPNYHTFSMLQAAETYETEWRDCPTRALSELINIVMHGGAVSCGPHDGLVVGMICSNLIND